MIFENQIVFYFEKGDQDYVKYWNEVEMNREDHIYSNIEDGFKKLKKGGQVVMHVNDAMVKGAHKSNPYSTPNIKTFGSSKSSLNFMSSGSKSVISHSKFCSFFWRLNQVKQG